MKKTNTYRFWAWLSIFTVPKSKMHDNNAFGEQWENLVIIEGKDANEAIAKALKFGQAEAGDCRGSLQLYRKPAIASFIGITDMGLIFDDLVDGCEILWRLKRARKGSVHSNVKMKRVLMKKLNKQLMISHRVK